MEHIIKSINHIGFVIGYDRILRVITTSDVKDFVNLFTQNVTYNVNGELTISRADALQAASVNTFVPELIHQHAISTESITLLPPFDGESAARSATGVLYFTTTTIGRGDLAGQALTAFVKFEDKYVKTGIFARYGGWRINARNNIAIVSSSKVD